MTYVGSLNSALHSLMSEDQRVYLIGEDLLDPYGGAFKVSRGLSTKFPDRVISSPISEGGITGVGIGMAMRGLLPVVEIMFGDFLALTVDQILNHGAKFPWMFNGQVEVPLVIRTPMGGYRGYGPTHSQSLESLFMSVPCLKMIAPSHFHDPGKLLSESIKHEKNLVLFIENKNLYPRKLILNSDPATSTPFKMKQLSSSFGSYPTISLSMCEEEPPDVTLIAYGGMALLAAQAAEEMYLKDEILVEIILPSQIKPVPVEDFLPSARTSGKVLILEEGPMTGGWGGEVASCLYELLFSELKEPIKRIGSLDLPIPSAQPMDQDVLPNISRLKEEIYAIFVK